MQRSALRLDVAWVMRAADHPGMRISTHHALQSELNAYLDPCPHAAFCS